MPLWNNSENHFSDEEDQQLSKLTEIEAKLNQLIAKRDDYMLQYQEVIHENVNFKN